MSSGADWLRFAQGDLAAARVPADADVPPRTATWSAQQAAEKVLKAVLVQRGEVVPRTHDLLDLATRARLDVTRMPSTRDLAELSFHAVQPRYPDDFVEAEADDARDAIQTAEAVVAQATRVLSAPQALQRDAPASLGQRLLSEHRARIRQVERLAREVDAV